MDFERVATVNALSPSSLVELKQQMDQTTQAMMGLTQVMTKSVGSVLPTHYPDRAATSAVTTQPAASRTFF